MYIHTYTLALEVLLKCVVHTMTLHQMFYTIVLGTAMELLHTYVQTSLAQLDHI